MKTIFSGIQPSGTIHLGNYLGAIRQWVGLQDDHESYYCIVDQHAITVPFDPKELPNHVADVAAIYLAAGLDPEESSIFVQSHVAAHTELAWLLSTITPFSELSRMTQFKEKSEKHAANINLGLFSYPVLMAADILLYGATTVPVGEDQIQHVELTREIARRFNNTYGEILTIPKALVSKTNARVMSLSDSAKKMSKSDNPKSYIAISDSADVTTKKIMSAVTETDPVFSFEHSGPAVQNLLGIYQALTEKSEQEIEKEFASSGYKEFKEALAKTVNNSLAPIRETYTELRDDDTELRLTLARGMQKAKERANQTLHQVKEAMGLM